MILRALKKPILRLADRGVHQWRRGRAACTLDKYVGDAIMAFFGDPETRGVAEDAKACVTMAIEMQHRIAELEQEWQRSGLERPLRARMGISTGFCTVGNFGSKDRMDYTIIGRAVNLASRLETAAEPGTVLISQDTWAVVKDAILVRELPALTLKGFGQPLPAYQLISLRDQPDRKIIQRNINGVRVTVEIDHGDSEQTIHLLKDIIVDIDKDTTYVESMKPALARDC